MRTRAAAEWAETSGVGIVWTRGTCWYIEQQKKDNGGQEQLKENRQETNTIEKKKKSQKKNSILFDTKLNNF